MQYGNAFNLVFLDNERPLKYLMLLKLKCGFLGYSIFSLKLAV